jgi:hypothetical protein
MIRQHVVRGISAPVAVGLLLLLGCSGKGDIIPMNLTPKMQTDTTSARSGGEAYGGASSDGHSV